jgi:hypothetical protein
MPCITGTEFEDYVWSGLWAREFPPSEGWSSEAQKPLLGGRFRPDFTAWRGSERAVGDAKDRATLTYDDVDKVIEDAGAFRATFCYLIIANDTNVPDGVRDHADRNSVAIIPTRWRAR